MNRVILFLGSEQHLRQLSDYSQIFKNNNYEVLEIEEAVEAEAVLEKRQVSLIIVYGFLADYINFIDNYSKKLPPIIYWYMPRVDEIPNREGVTLVDSILFPSQMMLVANELLKVR